MKISKRLIALFICLCMTVTCFGVVLAEETTPNTSEIVLAEEKTPNTSEVVTVTDDPTTMAAPAGYLAYYDPSLASGTPGFIGTNTAELTKYGFKGTSASYSSSVGNFQAFPNFTGKKQIPFAAKKNTTNTPEQKGEFYFTKDTINAPAPFNKTENGYVYEMEFGSLLRPQSAGDKTGIWEYRLMGLDSEAKEVEIATLQTKINGADIGTATSPEPSYGTASMKGVEGSREVSIPLWFQGQGVSTHVSYFRIYVDLKNQTYTAWLVKRADKNTAYEEKMPEKVDLLVKDVPFTSANKVTQLTGMQGWLTNAYNDPTHFTKVGVSQMNADKVIAEAKRDLTATEILNANSAENNIETDLTLPKVYQNTDVSWVSSATTIISDEGVVAQPINDTSVTMTATFSRGTKTDTRAFNLTVKGVGVIVDDAAKVAADKESLTLGDVSAVTENLTLPAIGLQGCSVTWKSDDTGIISDSGVVTRPEFNTVVTLTATITSNLVSDTKKFDVTVKGTTEVRTLEGVEGTYFAGGEFICETDKTVNFRDLFEGDGSNGTNGTVPWVDPVAGTGGLKAEQTEDGIKFSRTNSDGKNPGRGKAVLEAQYNLPVMENPTSAYYMELSFETSVTPALTFDFGSEGDKGVLQVRKKDDYVGDSAISPTEGPAAYDFKFDGSTKATAPFVAKEPATLGIYVIPQLKKVVVYKNGERVANKVFNYSDSESELLTLKVSWFQSIRWWNIGNEQITLKQCKVFKGDGIPAEETLKLDADALVLNEITSEKADQITKNLNLYKDGKFGSKITWASNNSAVDPATGIITRMESDQNVKLTATLAAGGKTITKEFDVVVQEKQIDGNLLVGKEVSMNITSIEPIQNLTDGNYKTCIETLDADKNPQIIIDLGEKMGFSNVVISEGMIDGAYSILKSVVEVSDDKNNWKKVGETNGIGEKSTVKFIPCFAQYIRFSVTNKEIGKNVRLYEIEAAVNATDNEVVQADLANTVGFNTYNVTQSTVFPTKGKFGSTITWKSSNTAVISDTGTVTPGKTGVDVTLTKTAKFGSATQVATEVHYVKGSGGNNNNGGGGSGGGNVSGGGGIINIIDKPVPEEVEKSVFPDVSKDSWAYNYIKTLAEKNVVSGDQNGNFNPEKPILREEYLKLLITALDFKIDKSATSNFSDVPNDSWFAPYVNTALRIGLVNGISEDLFGAGDKVTREDMAVMAYRALELKDISLDKTENTELKDIEKVSEYAKDAVNALANAKIITGDTAGYFNPFDVALREQAAKIIYLLMQEK